MKPKKQPRNRAAKKEVKENSNKVPMGMLVLLDEKLKGVKNSGLSQEAYLALLDFIDALTVQMKHYWKALDQIMLAFPEVKKIKDPRRGTQTFSIPDRLVGAVNAKIVELKSTMVEIKPLHFLSDTELYQFTIGLDMHNIGLIRQYLGGKKVKE